VIELRELGKWLKSLPASLKAFIAGSVLLQLIFLSLFGALAATTLSQIQKFQRPERAIISPRRLPSLKKILPPKPKIKRESPTKETVFVIRVIDGDTVEVEGGRKVRYIGIDCPEEGKLYSKEALAANRELVEGRIVTLVKDVSEKDVFGRLLRYVYVGDIFVNARLVEEGLAEATPYPPDLAYEDEFSELEKKAKDLGKGMWQEQSFQNQQGQQVMVYINEPGIEYHLPGCQKLGSNSKAVRLDEAKSKGYTPCSLCSPPP
jgi:micrococcal nuclease